MVTDDRHVIHPNVGGPTHAVSPYYRKLAEAGRLVQMLLTVAPEKDGPDLLVVQGILDRLFEQR